MCDIPNTNEYPKIKPIPIVEMETCSIRTRRTAFADVSLISFRSDLALNSLLSLKPHWSNFALLTLQSFWALFSLWSLWPLWSGGQLNLGNSVAKIGQFGPQGANRLPDD